MVKQPKWKTEPRPVQKVVPAAPVVVTYHEFKPSWRVGEMLLVHDVFGWHRINATRLANLQQRLRGYECRTWKEILHPPKKHPPDHFTPVESICRDAQKLLDASGLGDTDELVSLRIGGKGRLWGIMQTGGTLLVLWWDPDHLVYPMNIADN